MMDVPFSARVWYARHRLSIRKGYMKKCLILALLLSALFTLAFAECKTYARCPYDGESATLIESHHEGNGWVATYAHVHKDSNGQTYQHKFTKSCD